MSFKSFESIQQSHKRSHTNSHDSRESLDDGSPGSSKDPNFTSNSNELMEQFNKKANDIIKTMAGFHFSTTDLRNKLSKGHINNNCPIIAVGNVSQGQGQGQVRIDLSTCTISLEGDQEIPTQRDELEDQIFFL